MSTSTATIPGFFLRQLEGSRASVGLLGAGTSGGGGEIGSGDGVAARLVGAGGDGLRSSQEETAISSLGDGEGTAGVGASAVSDSGQGAIAGDGLVALDAGLGGLTGAGSVQSEIVTIWWQKRQNKVFSKMKSRGWCGVIVLTCTESCEERKKRRSQRRRRQRRQTRPWRQ